jgi:hypothetical protein
MGLCRDVLNEEESGVRVKQGVFEKSGGQAERAAPESRAQSKYGDVAARSLVGVELHRTANYRGDIVSDWGRAAKKTIFGVCH